MPILNTTPYINTVLSSLSSDQLTKLRNCVNGDSTIPVVKLNLNYVATLADYKAGETELGINPVEMIMRSYGAVATGYLIYTNTYCVLIGYNGSSQCLYVIDINPSTGVTTDRSQKLTIEELRRLLDDTAEHGGEVWVDTMKQYMNVNGSKIEVVGKKLFVGASGQGSDNSEVQAYTLTTNKIACLDSTGMDSPTVNIEDNLSVGALGGNKKIYLNGVELTSGGGGGTPWYIHVVEFTTSAAQGGETYTLYILSVFETAITNDTSLENTLMQGCISTLGGNSDSTKVVLGINMSGYMYVCTASTGLISVVNVDLSTDYSDMVFQIPFIESDEE